MKKVFVTLFSIFVIMMFTLSVSAASVTYYQTNKADVPIWSEASSKSTKVKTISTSGTVLKVIGTTTNSSGNLWYKLNDGTWVFSGNTTKHNHSYNSGGYCTGRDCGYEWPYSISSASGTYQVTNSSGAKVWSRPYSNNSTHLRTLSSGSALTINGKTTNKEDNLWYRLSDGGWVFSGNVEQRFAIYFNANGGSGAPGTQYVLKNTSFTLSTQKPTRSQYIFKGWSTSSGAFYASYSGGKSYKISSDITLYAVWSKCSHSSYEGGYCSTCGYEYPISVTSASGTYVVTNSDGAKVWSRPYSNKSTHVRTERKDAVLTIVGKTTNAENNVWYKISDGNWVYSGNINQRFAIYFNANGGSGAPATQYILKDTSFTLSNQKPTRSQYIFKGWATSSGSSSVSYTGGKSYKVSSDITLYAVWSKCSHSSYEGGYCSTCGYEYPINVTSASGTYVVTNSDGAKVWSRPYSNKSTHIRTEKKDATLTVIGKTTNAENNVWYKISDGNWVYSGNVKTQLTISYNANGGSGAPGTQTVTSGSSLKLSSSKPTRVGYTFQGWGTSSGSTSVSYKSGTSYIFNETITLYAVWKSCGHSAYTGGYCSSCGYEYPINVTSASGIYVVTNSEGAKVWSRPYSNKSTHVRTEKKNATLTVIGKTTNAENNVWYKISDGNWVYSGNVKIQLTISYNANGGSGAPGSQAVTSGSSLKLSSSKPTRVGYTFQGWATSSGSTSVSYKPGTSYTFSKNVTFYAVWKACSHSSYTGGYCSTCGYEYPINVTSASGTYVVTNSEGAKVWSRPYSNKSTHIRTEKKNATLTVIGKTTNAENNVWYKISDGNWVYSGNVKKQLTISYNANGGSGAPGSQTITSGSSLKLSSTKPARVGYTFQGWATSSDSTKVSYKPSTSYTFSKNVTLYAVWKSCGHSAYTGGYCSSCGYEYPINITSASGTYVVTNSEGAKVWSRPYSSKSTNIRTEKKNATLTVIGKTTNAENNVWYKISDGNWVYSGNITQRFTVKFDANGGESAPKSKTFLSGKNITILTDDPTRVGYVFLGWSTNKTATKATYKSGASTKFTKDATLYAVWKACAHLSYEGGICKTCKYEYPLDIIDVTATFKVTAEDGAPIWSRPYSNNSKRIRTAKKNTILDIIAKVKNYDKKTWYKLSDGNWVYSGNVTRQYTVTYDNNGGEGTIKAQTFLTGKSVTLRKTEPTLNGYIFLGWDTSKDAMKVVYKPGAKYSKKADVTLYAVWSRNGVDPVTEIKPANALSLSELERKYNNGEKAIDASLLPQKITYSNSAGTPIGYYVSENGCTWYAIARYNYVNKEENQLKFSMAGGNADNWAYSIDKNCFDAKSTDDKTAIKSNTIGVSTVSDFKGDSGVHVVYVECVSDGFVYYSEGAYPNPVSTFGYVKRKTVDEFAVEFEYIISAKMQ